jgi:adenylate kinase
MFFEYYRKQNYGGCILDGFPRTLNQAVLFDEKLGAFAKLTVIYLKVSDKLATERILGRMMCAKCYATYNIPSVPPKKPGICDFCQTELYHRQDDSLDIIKTRLSVFEEKTAPIIPYYQKQHKLYEIDSDQPIETIYDLILNHVR